MKRNLIKKASVLLTAMALLLPTVPVKVQAADGALTGKSAMEITKLMEKGWNLGNTFDATGGNRSDIYSQETSWGNPQVTKELIDGVAKAGYKTIRIPVTWNKFSDKRNGYAINPDFMARIKEVVTWAYDDGLFVIINCHHESWVNREDIDTAYTEIGEQLAGVWSQIADEFADFDQHLIFEGMNEPRAQGTSYEWNGNDKCYDAINYLDQVFVDTVRANGKGYNNERVLMIPGYAASCSANVLRSIVIPEIDGKPAENIAISTHCYSPYDFCLSDNQKTFNPSNASDTADIDRLMRDIKSLFLNNDIPVVIGECGCTNTQDNFSERQSWFKYFGEKTAEIGVPAIVWDNGAGGKSGGECHRYFIRKSGELVTPELTEAFLSGNYGNDPTTLGDMIIDFQPTDKDGNNVLSAPGDVGFTYSKLNNEAQVNHTEDAKLGFSMKVDENIPDFTASLDISKYAGVKVYVSAWICSKDGASVSVGISGAEDKEMVALNAGSEWTQVSFEYDIPEGAKAYVYFKGSDNKFNVDDIRVGLTPADDSSNEAIQSENSADEEIEAAESANTDGPITVTEGAISNAEERKGKFPFSIIMIITGVIAIIAGVVIVVGSKKK